MDIKSREIKQIVVDEINITPADWDRGSQGTSAWRLHMAKLLNQRVCKLAPQCSTPDEFYQRLYQYTRDIGFGHYLVVVKVTEMLYKVEKVQEEKAA